MSDMIQSGFDYAVLPSEVALKAQLAANSIKLRLKRTVEDIIEIGRELKEVKPSLEGRFDAWFEAETGLDRQMAYKFIGATEKFGSGAYNNYTSLSPTVIYLLSAPSTPDSVVQQAIEKAESGAKVTVADVKDWKAELEAERQARLTAERHNEEWRAQYKVERDAKRKLEQQVSLLKEQSAPEPQVIEKIPDDYEAIKKQVSEVQAELKRVKQEQAKAIQEGIKTKLKSYQDEVDRIENKKRNLEKQAKDYQDYLTSLGSKTKQLEAQNRAIEKLRQALVDYASEMSDFELTDNEETLRRWEHLLIMLQNAQAVTQAFVGGIDPVKEIA